MEKGIQLQFILERERGGGRDGLGLGYGGESSHYLILQYDLVHGNKVYDVSST